MESPREFEWRHQGLSCSHVFQLLLVLSWSADYSTCVLLMVEPMTNLVGEMAAMKTALKKGLLIVAGVAIFSQVSIGFASAQDLLPADNGIFKYHKSPRYRESESHPLRLVAYILHPIGWVAREGVFRPLSSFMGSTAFTRSFFGFREPFDYREPVCYADPGAIPNCQEISPLNAKGSSAAPSAEASLTPGQQVYFPEVAFEFDKSTLNPLGRARVRQVAQLLASVPNVKVVVEGHTDSVGTDQYNMKLGERRAQTVMKELTELGIDPARMTPTSFGESRPLFTEDEDWARAANRRVQFSVAGQQPAPAPVAEVKS